MPSIRLGRVVVAIGGATMIAALVVTAGASARTNGPFGSVRHILPGSKPAWTTVAPQAAAVPSGRLVHARVWLTPRNAAQLDALAQAVSDPSSAQYGQFLTADQYNAQYAPTADQVGQVTQWLTQSGLSVTATGPDNHFIAVAGSASAIASAFGASLADYLVNGKQAQAPVADVSVPDSLAGLVTSVTGLSTLGHAVKPADFGAPDAFVNATPCSDYYGQQTARTLPRFQHQTLPYAVCGYTPDQLRGAYGVNGFRNAQNIGRGQTVAITDAYDAPTLLADANRYAMRQGDRPFSHGQFQDRSVPEDASTGNDCGGNGWYGEQSLDVEAVHGMAPGANVLYYGAASCFDDDLLAQLSQVVHDNKASIVTNSWGEPTFVVINGQLVETIDDSLVAAYESIFKQGVVQGIGFMFSSGDNGDELDAFGYAHPDYPTGDPWVTSVGGTSLAIDRRNNRAFETGWGTEKYGLSSDGSSWNLTVPFLYGAGGGISQVFPEPAYQRGIVGHVSGRAVPDVAMDADPTTGMLV
ncbi:MAG TPA: S53 family peptidase, partial [Gaiellaceae bacterium]|nr:S53 family peptidase [Gaiellaceae bacterium]